MTSDNWRDAVADIEKTTALATQRQHQLAAPGGSAGVDCLPLPKAPSACAGRLELMAGDIVEIDGSEQVAEISSIGSQGRVYFKGMGSGGAWPDQLIVRSRKDDNSAEARELRRQVANNAALSARIEFPNPAKLNQLCSYEVETALTLEVVEELQTVVDAAQDERPIQDFMEARPQTLAALLGGRDRFVLPRRSLAGKYVPDFLVCDTDSLGLRWVLVELETPKSSITLSTKNELDASARRGVTQIKEWREWLQNNLDMARRPIEQEWARPARYSAPERGTCLGRAAFRFE